VNGRDIVGLLQARRGHFLLESGHHGDLWLELDSLFARPARLEPFAAELARRLAAHGIDVVCDVVNAASATRATLDELRSCGASVVAIGALVTLGDAAEALAEREGLALERLAALPNTLWQPADCPMCAAGEALARPG
jgi:orotate phosphoribosyltransferase